MANATSTEKTATGPASPVVWFEVIGQDAAKQRAFYGELLGWEFQLDPSLGYGIVAGADQGPGIGGGIGAAHPGQPSWVTFYVRVADLEATIERAKALGSRVLIPPTPIPSGRIAVVSDPEGLPVGLCT